MKKIPTLFQRNYDGDHLVRNEVTPGAEWVLAGEGIATRKFDGSAVMIDRGTYYKRYELKNGKPTPPLFVPADEPDKITGSWPGWVPVSDVPEDRWFRIALDNYNRELIDQAGGLDAGIEGMFALDGTYEAIGPHFQGNPEGAAVDTLVRHGKSELLSSPRTFDGLRAFLAPGHIEGIVWHHSDGRMVKLKARDFERKRPGNRMAAK